MKASKHGRHFYDFGPFRLDVMQRVLFREQVPVPLTGKAFDTLLVLVQNSGRIVGKDELMKTVWPDTIVEENNLNQNISAARKAVGEGRDGRPYIETVPRRGFRFEAKVSDGWDKSANLNSRWPAKPSSARQAEGKRFGWFLTGGILLLLIGIAVVYFPPLRLGRPRSPNAGQRSGIPALTQGRYLAVLPFRVVGDDSSLHYVAEGLASVLSARLSGARGIHVASAAAVERADKTGSLDKTASELGANLLLQGTLEGTTEKMRIVINLEDLADGRRLFSAEFPGAARDMLGLNDRIYSKLVVGLGLEPASLELGEGGANLTGNIAAYDLYLRGQEALRRRQELKSVEAAVRLHEEALKNDPGFALAYAGLADACLEIYREKKESFWAEKALMAAEQARRLGDNLAEVHFSLGSVYEVTGRAEEAIAEERSGLELAPNSDEGYRRLGSAYLVLGRKEEAVQAYLKAIEVNPYYWFSFNLLGEAWFQMGDYDKALSAFARVTELEPDNVYGYENVGAVYTSEGKWSESIQAFQKALRLHPDFVAYSNLGTAYFYLSRYEEAAKMFEKAAQMNPNQQIVLGNLGDAYRWSGQAKKALATYDRAIALAYKELQVNPRKASTLESLALYYAKKGDRSQALEFIHRARSIDPNDVQIIYGEGVVQALVGQPQEALRALREAFQRGYSPEEASIDPELRTLRTRPDFQQLMNVRSRKKS